MLTFGSAAPAALAAASTCLGQPEAPPVWRGLMSAAPLLPETNAMALAETNVMLGAAMTDLGDPDEPWGQQVCRQQLQQPAAGLLAVLAAADAGAAAVVW